MEDKKKKQLPNRFAECRISNTPSGSGDGGSSSVSKVAVETKVCHPQTAACSGNDYSLNIKHGF